MPRAGKMVGMAPIGDPAAPAKPATTPATPAAPQTVSEPSPAPPAATQKAEVGVGKRGRGYGAGPISTPVATYFSAKERLAFLSVQQALSMFKATEGRAPSSHDEFMKKIIQENRIPLPQLPEDKKYRYDPKTEELMVDTEQ